MKLLSSRHHPLVAACRKLARGGDGDRVLLDGAHLVSEALRAGIRLDVVAATSRTLAEPEGGRLAADVTAAGADLVQVSEAMMSAMSPVPTPSGIVAIGRRPAWSIEDVLAAAPQLVVVAVDVQEPGNVGAIVRAAEACGATGVACCGASADPFGWKALRGAMGSTLRLPVAAGVSVGAVSAAARRHGVRVAATVPRGGTDPRGVDLRSPVACIVGGEGPGLPPALIDSADLVLSLPMRAPVESLNVAVAAALLVYEASSQRCTVSSPHDLRAPRPDRVRREPL
jgi:RNA methyltransferase, TrmH family